jgi:hypothetical protein
MNKDIFGLIWSYIGAAVMCYALFYSDILSTKLNKDIFVLSGTALYCGLIIFAHLTATYNKND